MIVVSFGAGAGSETGAAWASSAAAFEVLPNISDTEDDLTSGSEAAPPKSSAGVTLCVESAGFSSGASTFFDTFSKMYLFLFLLLRSWK